MPSPKRSVAQRVTPAQIVNRAFVDAQRMIPASAPAPGPARPMTVMEDAMGSIDRRLAELACAIDSLEDGLTSVLVPMESMPRPDGGTDLGPAPPPMAPAIEMLHAYTAAIEQTVNRINSLRSRVQA